MTQWHDERDKGERDRGITRWDEEKGVIMGCLVFFKQGDILTILCIFKTLKMAKGGSQPIFFFKSKEKKQLGDGGRMLRPSRGSS